MTSQSFWGINLGRDPKLRAADSDREATADRLRRSHAEGRLDTNELQQRLERCYDAKTLGQLDELVTDLPREPTAGQRAPRRGLGFWNWRAIPFIPILVALIVVCAVTGHHAPWLFVALAFLLYRLRWRRMGMGGRRSPGDWA
jgi:Flp pilus assembly protein TadB